MSQLSDLAAVSANGRDAVAARGSARGASFPPSDCEIRMRTIVRASVALAFLGGCSAAAFAEIWADRKIPSDRA